MRNVLHGAVRLADRTRWSQERKMDDKSLKVGSAGQVGCFGLQ